MSLVTSYPNKQVPILQSNTVDLVEYETPKGSTGGAQSRLVGILPEADGTITVSMEGDDLTVVPAGVQYTVSAGIPLIGRIRRVWATGTSLADADMWGLLITR